MKNLFKALADFQQEVPSIYQKSQGHGYKYASLDDVVKTINPVLKKNGLGFSQPIKEGKILTILFHSESGEMLESEMDLSFIDLQYQSTVKKDRNGNEYEKLVIPGFEGMNRAQAMGAVITYFRRYSLTSMLGIISDEDIDAKPQSAPQQPQNYSTGQPARTNGTPQQATAKPQQADQRPWLNEKSFLKIQERMIKGEPGVLEKAEKAFRMKREYRHTLQQLQKN